MFAFPEIIRFTEVNHKKQWRGYTATADDLVGFNLQKCYVVQVRVGYFSQ